MLKNVQFLEIDLKFRDRNVVQMLLVNYDEFIGCQWEYWNEQARQQASMYMEKPIKYGIFDKLLGRGKKESTLF